jgi:hypothetical protein
VPFTTRREVMACPKCAGRSFNYQRLVFRPRGAKRYCHQIICSECGFLGVTALDFSSSIINWSVQKRRLTDVKLPWGLAEDDTEVL